MIEGVRRCNTHSGRAGMIAIGLPVRNQPKGGIVVRLLNGAVSHRKCPFKRVRTDRIPRSRKLRRLGQRAES